MEGGIARLLSRWAPGQDRRPPQGKDVKVRVSVVLPRGEEILLVRHRRDARFYWVLPGGGLEPGESLTECGAREIREETGLEVGIQRLLYVGEVRSPSGKKHILDLVFLGELAEFGQRLRPSRHWVIEEPRFVPLRELPSMALYPPIVFELLEDAEAGWQKSPRYLGNLWVDAEPEEIGSRAGPCIGRKPVPPGTRPSNTGNF
jgi:ADP-ribose pyrophosphatase YjhB (NUDIX family)